MSIERTTQLIKQNENIRLEFKEAARALPGNLFETICAMLNSKFFLQLGRVDELGSGVLNVNRLIKQYAGENLPQFIEGHIFKMILPVANGEN
ncbi:MAG: helix-turn-helix domain-containing protein, partial [Bacteroidia bacterium]